jgi:hypothetical protein
MPQVHLQQIPLREVHLLEHSHCSAFNVSLNIPQVVRFGSRNGLEDPFPFSSSDTLAVYNKLGYHWATTLLAFLTLVMSPFP